MSNKKESLKIIKRNGRTVPFDITKIVDAIAKAGDANKAFDQKEAKRLADIVKSILNKTFTNQMPPPTVEHIQDLVEQVLMAAGYYAVAKAYILYREAHAKQRAIRSAMGVSDDLGFGTNALKVMERRYMQHDQEGNVIETPKQMFERVARTIAQIEDNYSKSSYGSGVLEDAFFKMMVNREFVPAGGYFRGAGTHSSQLANCFVLPIEDSMEAIFDAVKWTALIHKTGGGTGFNFSNLRPRGDVVKGSNGFSSGPIPFMKVFDAATRQVGQGGFKRGANMGILNIDHPDILEFISCKQEDGEISNFNISVGITDTFMKALNRGAKYSLINPRDKKVVMRIDAGKVWGQIISLAWRTGDPGLIFLDTINRDNPVIDTLGPIIATNVCGEQPLHSFDVCNLGSINLSAFYSQEGSDGIDWPRLKEVTSLAVRFLDNGVDASSYPITQIQKMAMDNRRIGLGVMGFADLLYQLRIPYNSEEGIKIAKKIMAFINQEAHRSSSQIAEEKGVFPNWKGSIYQKQKKKLRNIAVTTIAPTGTISMLANCSSGIEPVFALSFVKNVVDESGLLYVNEYFAKALKEANIYSDEVIGEVSKHGSINGIKEIPKKLQNVFVTAHDIDPLWHIKMQAAFQKYTDNAVSKTINFPFNATMEDIEKAYLLAWRLGCKGVTVYRDGSKNDQILRLTKDVKSSSKTIIQSKIKQVPLSKRNELD